MPLPANNLAWPPLATQPMYAKMEEWSAWYSGEPSRIIDVYSSQGTQGGVGVPWWRFWSRAKAGRDGAQRAMIHVPVASDLAGLSAALLFGEVPRIWIKNEDKMKEIEEDKVAAAAEAKAAVTPIDPFDEDSRQAAVDADAEQRAEAAPKPEPETPEEKSQKHLRDILERGDFYSRLIEAAESAAAIGGVYIYPMWDKDLRDFPFLAVAQADQAVPEFKWGMLSKVTFFRDVIRDGSKVLRHVEVHEIEGTGETRKAVILNALYEGTGNMLGEQRQLTDSVLTANLQPRVELPFKELDVEYVPNIRPNRLFRASGHGVADIQGSETLLDALDETYASWMRDIRLAKARIIVPREYLRVDPADPNKVPAFDTDQEVYVAMDMDPGLTQDARAMMAHQFNIRYIEHRDTAKDLVARIVSNAGYTPTTMGLTEGAGPTTGAALRVQEHRTILTLMRKSRFWRSALVNVLEHMMIIDAEEFASGVEPFRPTIVTADSIVDNPLELAQTALAMHSAEAASIETLVRTLHPDWGEAEIKAEVMRIEDSTPEPPSVFGAAGPLPPEEFGDERADAAAGASSFPIKKKGSRNDSGGGAQPNAKAPK